jgi:phosphate-selective porin OprO/OprP
MQPTIGSIGLVMALATLVYVAPARGADATAVAAAPAEEATPLPAQSPPIEPVPAPIYVPRPGTEETVRMPPPVRGPSQPGYIINTPQGDMLVVGGYIHANERLFVGNGSSAYVNQFLLRQARPVLEGTIRNHLDFRLLPDFAGGKVVIQEAWADVRYLPFLKLRVGKMKVPVSLERLQNSNAVIFVERAFASELAPNRDVGAQLFGDIDGVVAYQLGIFDGVVDNGINQTDAATSGDKEGAARLFLMPFSRTEISPLKGLGLGVSGTWSAPKGSASAPQLPTYLSPGQNTIFAYVTSSDPTKAVVADGNHVRWDVQGYYYWGPFGAQAEYIRSMQRVKKGTTVLHTTNWAWEASASLVLTGEKATFGMIVPDNPFDPAAGRWGAVEVTARHHQIKFDDAVFANGFADPASSVSRANAWGAGVNWYFDRSLRFMVDYDRTNYFGGVPGGNKAPEQVVIGNVQTVF